MADWTGAQHVVRALEDEGVRLAFGIPGTHNIELYDALGGSRTVRPILVTDEQSASFMADGVWRASGELGCANLVPGAGLTHALSGIAEAYLDGIPMLVLGCGIRRDTEHRFQLHDVDQLAIARPVTKAQLRPADGSRIYETVRRACALARMPPGGPVLVEIPADLYMHRYAAPEERGASAAPAAPPAPAPDPEALGRALDLLAASRRPLLYLGLGAAGAGSRLVELAERLQAPVSTTFQGKGIFPETHPLWLWPGFGRAAPPALREIAGGCDLTLAIGCRFAEVGTGSYGLEPPGPLIHVDIDPAAVGRNYPAEVGIVADAAEFVGALLRELPAREPGERQSPGREPGRESGRDLRSELAEAHAGVQRDWESAPGSESVTPYRLIRALQETFGPDAIYTTDSGNGTFIAMECLRLDRPRSFLAPIDYSCMGYAVPAALGAALASPDRPVVALAGDGALLMTGLELLTAVHYGIPAVVVVLRDRALAQIAQLQRTAFNRTTASDLPDYDLARLCDGIGVRHVPLRSDEELEDVLGVARAAREEGGPIVVEAAIDYSEKTYFTRGIVRTVLGRLDWPDRLRFVGRALLRRLPGAAS